MGGDGDGIPRFSGVHITPFHFWKRLTLIPVFANKKKPKEDFSHKKKRESNI